MEKMLQQTTLELETATVNIALPLPTYVSLESQRKKEMQDVEIEESHNIIIDALRVAYRYVLYLVACIFSSLCLYGVRGLDKDTFVPVPSAGAKDVDH
jgi:hypothetical protein